jgi:hypothetical protein
MAILWCFEAVAVEPKAAGDELRCRAATACNVHEG